MKQSITSKQDIIRDELLKLQTRKALTAENILEEARKKSSPLHEFFDWNDTTAAEKWRVHQARLLINYVIEPVEEGEAKNYSFELIDLNGEKEYQHINKILNEPEWRQQIVEQAISYLKYWKGKYIRYNFTELIPILKEIEKLDGQTRNHRKIAT